MKSQEDSQNISLTALQQWLIDNLPDAPGDPNSYTRKRLSAGIPPNSQKCSRSQAEKFIASCLSHSNDPRRVLRFLAQNRADIARALQNFQSEQPGSSRISQPVYGSKLAGEIMVHSGIHRTDRTLYLWGERLTAKMGIDLKFAPNRLFTVTEANLYLDFARAERAARKAWGRKLGLANRSRKPSHQAA